MREEREPGMRRVLVGHTQTQPSGYDSFVPSSFPPADLLPCPHGITKKATEASRMLGKLDGVTRLLPDADYFLRMYLRKDAASSSQIEGTQATMIDSIEAEVHSSPSIPDDVDDIQHYLKALNYGMKRVAEEGFPVSLRLVRELHSVLLLGARATQFSDPGEFRKTQNWIGGTTIKTASFVPPTAEDIKPALGDLERFIHAQEDDIPILVKAGLLHAQFETLHPFLDGNGRTGRMLITIFLWNEGFLEKPVLFLSSYFQQHRDTYYDLLSAYRYGEVFEWLDFFLDGVIAIAGEAIEIADQVVQLRLKDMALIQSLGKRGAETSIKILSHLYAQPIVDVRTIKSWTGLTRDGAHKALARFVDLGILTPKSVGPQLRQSFMYKDYLDIFMLE